MDKVTSENEMENFLQEIDKDKLLRAEELEEIKRGFGEKKEDHDTARRHLIEKLKVDQQIGALFRGVWLGFTKYE